MLLVNVTFIMKMTFQKLNSPLAKYSLDTCTISHAYQTHNQSLELEQKLAEQVEERISEMQAESMSYTEQQAIYKAFDVLQQCRRTLKYTYAFAFYLYRNNQAEVFEQNQADLERATEALSGFLEREIDAEQNTSLQLMDKTRYCDHRRSILLTHCQRRLQRTLLGWFKSLLTMRTKSLVKKLYA